MDCRPFPFNTICPDASSMATDDTVNNGKTYPGTLKRCLRMKSVEWPLVRRRKVLNEDDGEI
jgi:hypothetical protein